MAKNNPKSAFTTEASDTELANVLRELVEDDVVSADIVNDRLSSMREGFSGKVNAATAIEEEKVEIQSKLAFPLSLEQKEQLLSTLKARFESNMKRHKGIKWGKVEAKLNEASPEKLWSLNEMERTGGEPDVVGYIEDTGEYEFFDCSEESPSGRRNICYDRKGQEEAEGREAHPAGNAVDMAVAMGLGGILDEDQIRNKLQKLGEFDRMTFSWVKTPDDKRKQGVALHAFRSSLGVGVTNDIPRFHGIDRAFRGWLRV